MKRIVMTDGNIMLYGYLNDTVAAGDFKTRIPCSATLIDDGFCYKCRVAYGVYNPLEGDCKRRIGDIILEDGFFKINYEKDETSTDFLNMTIIGCLDQESIDKLKKQDDKIKLYVNFE